QHLLIGAGTAALAEKLASVLARLGCERALIVHGEDGLDEVSLGGPTQVYEVVGHDVRRLTFTPADAGLAPMPLEAVRTGTAAENSVRVRAVLEGIRGADRDYVLINAGAGLLAAGRVSDLRAGVAAASESIDSGAALRVLDAFVATTQSFGEGA